MIPEKLLQIRETAKCCLNKRGDNNVISGKNLFYLERVEKEDIVYISAPGMFKITGEFILSAIGVTLTYDLLLIHIR